MMKFLRCKAFWGSLLFFIIGSTNSYAEYNHELGVSGGAAFYLGDANKSALFNRANFSVGGLYRYNIDTRWAVKLNIRYARIAGDTRDFGYILPNGQEYASFERGLVDSNVAIEFNFFDIGESKYYVAKYRVTPYIMLGLGVTAYNDLYGDGNAFLFNIPVGIGAKWKINRRFTLGLEWTITKLFTDRLDVTDSTNAILDNPYGVSSTGFFDTDWYSVANLYLTVNLFETNKFCK